MVMPQCLHGTDAACMLLHAIKVQPHAALRSGTIEAS
jgi:hypothetical protein